MLVESVLDSRASFDFAALIVSWVVLGLLVIVVGSLNSRLRRLEQASAGPAPTAYGHLVGRRLEDVTQIPDDVRVLIFVSSGCGACRRLLDELESQSWTTPAAIVWTDGSPPTDGRRPDIPLLADGPRIAAELGIRVAPFALVLDDQGTVVRAGPVSSLRSLDRDNGRARAVPVASGIFERKA